MKTIAALGDSYSYNESYGTRAHEFYPHYLAKLVEAGGVPCQARNFGRSGDSTPMVLSRAGFVDNWETPDIAVLFAGTNDTNSGHFSTVQASPAPTSTSLSVGSGVGASMPAGSYITINNVPAIVQTRTVDALTFSPAYAGIAAGQAVLPDTQANLVAAILALKGHSRVVVVGDLFHNFSTGGDTVLVEQAAAKILRAKQKAAAAATDVPYVDLYAYCSARITAGIDTAGDFAYHVLDSNAHPSPYGSSVIARAIYDTIHQLGWV